MAQLSKINLLLIFIFLSFSSYAKPLIDNSKTIEAKDDAIAIIHEGDGNVIIGFTIKQHEEKLKRRIKEVKEELSKLHKKDRTIFEQNLQILLLEKNQLEGQLSDSKVSFQKKIKFLESQMKSLEKVKDKVSKTMLDDAKLAISKGDTKKALLLFRQIEEDEENIKTIKLMAEVAYQQCKITYQDFYIRRAFKNCLRANQLEPGNRLYSNKLAKLAIILGEFELSEKLYNQELDVDIEEFGIHHENISTHYNHLGSLWTNRADNKIDPVKLLDIFTVAKENKANYDEIEELLDNMDQINEFVRVLISMAYESSGNEPNPDNELSKYADFLNIDITNLQKAYYKVAIAYYENALYLDKKIYGTDHLNIANDYKRIGNVWEKLGIAKSNNKLKRRYYVRAFKYYFKALTIYNNKPDEEEINQALIYMKSNKLLSILSIHGVRVKSDKIIMIKEGIIKYHSNEGNPDFSYFDSHRELCGLRARKKEYKKAIAHCEKSLNLKKITSPSQHIFNVESYGLLSRLWSKLGDAKKEQFYKSKCVESARLNFEPELKMLNSSDKNKLNKKIEGVISYKC